MKLWYNKIDNGEVTSKKELIKDFYRYWFFSIFGLICGLLLMILSVFRIEFLGLAIFMFYFASSSENNMRQVKNYYRENYFNKKERL